MAFEKFKKFIDGDDIDNTEDEISFNIKEKGKEKVSANQGLGNQMILVEPRAYSESQTIADHLKGRNTVVVNLKRVTAAQAKRIIDFLTGTLYAIEGDLQKVGPGIYLCTPKNVKVQGKISEDEDKKDKDDDEINW